MASAVREQRMSRKWGWMIELQSLPPSHLLPPARSHLLTVPQPFQTVPPPRVRKHKPVGVQFTLKPQTINSRRVGDDVSVWRLVNPRERSSTEHRSDWKDCDSRGQLSLMSSCYNFIKRLTHWLCKSPYNLVISLCVSVSLYFSHTCVCASLIFWKILHTVTFTVGISHYTNTKPF